MTGHQIAENLRTTKLRWTTGTLHKVMNGEDYFCVLGMKAFEAGVPISRLDASWDSPVASTTYGINDTAGLPDNPDDPYPSMDFRKQAAINTFDSPLYRDVNFPVEEFIAYLKATIE